MNDQPHGMPISDLVYELSMRDDVHDEGIRLDDDERMNDDVGWGDDETDDEVHVEDDMVAKDDRDDDAPSEVHKPTATWFEEEQIMDNYVDHRDFGPIFDISDSKLFVGALFATKALFLTVLKGSHIKDHRDYIVLRRNPDLFVARCVRTGCPWRILDAKMLKHGFFKIRKLPA